MKPDLSRLRKNFDENRMRKLFNFHKTGGIAYKNLIDYNKNPFSDGFMKFLMRFYNKNMVRNTIFYDFYLNLKKRFPDIIPLKGIYLLQNIYRENYGIRFMSDIDIFIDGYNIYEILDYLRELDFHLPDRSEIEHCIRFRSHITVWGDYKNFQINFEPHWQPFEIPLKFNKKMIYNKFFVSTIHSVFHYFTDRLYHFTEWCYIDDMEMDKKTVLNELKEIGLFNDYKKLLKLKEDFYNVRNFPYPFNRFIKACKRPGIFERFYFWFFIEKELKRNKKYFKRFIGRELLR
jgi:hypothetical protein